MRQTHTSWRFAVLLTGASAFLDAYTLTTRGVFFSAQTGNMVGMMVAFAKLKPTLALGHLWSLLAFMGGSLLATHLRARWMNSVHFPLRWVLATHATLLVIVGFIPVSTPSAVVIVPLSVMGGMLFELFRKVGPDAYVPVATTGNLVRLTESVHGALVERRPDAQRALPVHASIVAAFAVGALVGAVVSQLLGVRASWVAAVGFLGILALFVIDDRVDRAGTQPDDDPVG